MSVVFTLLQHNKRCHPEGGAFLWRVLLLLAQNWFDSGSSTMKLIQHKPLVFSPPNKWFSNSAFCWHDFCWLESSLLDLVNDVLRRGGCFMLLNKARCLHLLTAQPLLVSLTVTTGLVSAKLFISRLCRSLSPEKPSVKPLFAYHYNLTCEDDRERIHSKKPQMML